MILWDICRAEEYKDKEGNTKTKWHNLGTLFEKDGKYSVKIAGVWYNVFPKKDEQTNSKDNVSLDSIPF